MLYNFFVGTLLGSGLILPGVSGAVLAIIFGVYERLLDSITCFFKAKKKNFLFLFPIILGMLVGVLIFGRILNFVFSEYYMQSSFLFIGLIIGGIPVLFKKIKFEKEKVNYKFLFFSFFIAVFFFFLNKISFDISFDNLNSNLRMFLGGFIFISGKIIPGISSSFMMMLIGMYEYILNFLSNPIEGFSKDTIGIILFAIGSLVGFIVFAKIIKYALKKYFAITYSLIIGFVMGSIIAIYPGFSFDLSGFIALILLIIGLYCSYKISLLKFRNK